MLEVEEDWAAELERRQAEIESEAVSFLHYDTVKR